MELCISCIYSCSSAVFHAFSSALWIAFASDPGISGGIFASNRANRLALEVSASRRSGRIARISSSRLCGLTCRCTFNL